MWTWSCSSNDDGWGGIVLRIIDLLNLLSLSRRGEGEQISNPLSLDPSMDATYSTKDHSI